MGCSYNLFMALLLLLLHLYLNKPNQPTIGVTNKIFVVVVEAPGMTTERGGHRPPHSQLCRTNDHYASSCPNLHTYTSNTSTSYVNLAQAFHYKCHVT